MLLLLYCHHHHSIIIPDWFLSVDYRNRSQPWKSYKMLKNILMINQISRFKHVVLLLQTIQNIMSAKTYCWKSWVVGGFCPWHSTFGMINHWQIDLKLLQTKDTLNQMSRSITKCEERNKKIKEMWISTHLLMNWLIWVLFYFKWIN